MDAKKLIELRKQAEKAVKDMPDNEFKLKAFEVILSHLLAPGKPEQSLDAGSQPAHSATSSTAPEDRDEQSAQGRILVLRAEGFFKKPQSIGKTRSELAAHGWHYPVTTLSGELIRLVQKRQLRRQRGKEGNRQVWLYANA
jgi:hypothetical protein